LCIPDNGSLWLKNVVNINENMDKVVICSGTDAGFLQILRFLSLLSFCQMLDTVLSSGAGRITRLVADMPNGLKLIPQHHTPHIPQLHKTKIRK
jgi:hypothetical protein